MFNQSSMNSASNSLAINFAPNLQSGSGTMNPKFESTQSPTSYQTPTFDTSDELSAKVRARIRGSQNDMGSDDSSDLFYDTENEYGGGGGLPVGEFINNKPVGGGADMGGLVWIGGAIAGIMILSSLAKSKKKKG